MTESQELLYIAASIKTNLQTADRALRAAIQDLRVLDSHKDALDRVQQLTKIAVVGTGKALDHMFEYIREEWPDVDADKTPDESP